MWGRVILGEIRPIGQISNDDESREFQIRGKEHIHAPIHVVAAPRLGDDDDDDDDNDDDDKTKEDEVISFIDNYISCSIPNEKAHPKLSSLVKGVQTHDHNTTYRKKKELLVDSVFPGHDLKELW